MSTVVDKTIQDVYKFKNILSVNFKITAMDESMNYLYLGDTNGKMYRYYLHRKDMEFISEGQAQPKQLTNQKIDLIKALPFGRDLLVISNSNLYHIDGETLQTKQTIISGGVVNLVLNESTSNKNEVLVSLKNNKLIVLEFNINTHEYMQEKVQLPPLADTPLTMAFLGSLIYYGKSQFLTKYFTSCYILSQGTKREYCLIDLNKKLQPQPLQMSVSPYPYIKVTDNDELFILVTNTNTGLLIGRDGIPKPKATFEPVAKPIIQISVQKPYLIILYEGLLQVFNMQDSKKIQENDFMGGGKRLVASQGTIIYATQQKLSLLEEIPFENRIQECLKTCRVDDAMAIFYQSVQKDDPQFKDKEETIYLDAAWNLIEQCRFREAKNKLENREFDVREIISFFRDLIPLNMQNKVTVNNNKNISVILGRFSDKVKQEAAEKEAYEMLVDLLEKRRNKYNSSTYKQQYQQKMTYNQSVYSLSKQSQEIPLSEIMTLIDFALIKIFIKRKNTSQLCELMKNSKPINCKNYFVDIYQSIKDAQIEVKEPEIIPYFFEKFDRIKEALDKWREIGMSLTSKYDNACSETIRILLLIDDSKRITEYLGWVIKKNVEFGKEFFKKVKESVISPEQMLTFINEGIYSKNEQGLTEKLIETYLEILVVEKKISESRFHTKLASNYVDSLFKLVPRDVDAKEAPEKLNDFGQKLYKKFVAFCQNPNSNYDPQYLLEKVKKSWLIREEIYFYGKSKKHKEALEQMIHKLKEYKMAEEYCQQHNDKTLTIMFRIYIEYYNSVCNFLQNEIIDLKKKQLSEIKSEWENRINIFIKKYGTHPNLDPFEVLMLIPDNWKLVEFNGTSGQADDGLYSFLTQIISHSLHTRRQVNCAKHLSEMDLQNVKCNLINSKKANVRITEDKKCAICHKSIGDKTVCIYPNAVVADQKCVSNGQSLSVCPQTLQDFEKTFRG